MPRLIGAIAVLLTFGLASCVSAPTATAYHPPPANETPAQRASRFETWRAANRDVSTRIARVVTETRALVASYRAATTTGADRSAVPARVIFRTRGVGTSLWDCVMCPELAIAPAGTFTIGSPPNEPGRQKDEGPQRRVLIPRAIAVSRFEVTRGEYEAFVRATGHPVSGNCVTDRRHKGEWTPDSNTTLRDPGFTQTDAHPVVCVSLFDAQAYVAWLNTQTAGGYRLLSEAEWEYLARAGSTTTYPWGPDVNEGCAHMNGMDATARSKYPDFPTATCNDGARNTAPVGSYRPNAFGLYDMIGNVEEWVQGCATDSYSSLPPDGAANAPNAVIGASDGDCPRRVVRGGAWGNLPPNLRSADRIRFPATLEDDSIGIRVAKTLE